ncbi:MAG: hypothetical protein APR62_12575 [Smithella sp. SDB]|nr:MAG: hypothetical protein APR62_12575 [Smithella sp. SDB]
MVITTPDNAALDEFRAVTVIVEVVEPSDFTVGGEAIRSKLAAVTVVPSSPVSAVSVLPPQAIRIQIKSKERNSRNGWKNFDLVALIIITLLIKSGIDNAFCNLNFYQKFQ